MTIELLHQHPAPAPPAPAAVAVLHLTWAPTQGLVWWMERTQGAVATVPGRHPMAAASPYRRQFARWMNPCDPLTEVLRGRGRSVRMLLPCRDGVALPSAQVVALGAAEPGATVARQVPGPRSEGLQVVPGVVVVPVFAPPVLMTLYAITDQPDPRFVYGAGVDYLRAVTRDVRTLVAGGRVVPDVGTDRSGNAVATWRLAPDEDLAEWFSAQVTAMPPALRAVLPAGRRRSEANSAATVLAGVLEALVPVIVREKLRQQGSHAHPLLASLLTGGALQLPVEATTRLRDGLRAWARSHHQRRVNVVLRLEEPAVVTDCENDTDSDDNTIDTDNQTDGRAPTSAQSEYWPLDVMVALDEEAPTSLSALTGDQEAVSALKTGLAMALQVLPALRSADRDPVDDARLWVPTATVLELVDRGADLLRQAGVTVLLPRQWIRVEPTMELDATAEEVEEDAAIGLAGVVSWNWSVALGGQRLSEGELDELAEAKQGLVKLRGSWVRLNPHTLASARRYVKRSTASAQGSLAGLLGELTGEPPPAEVTSVGATGWLGALFRGVEGREIPEVDQPADLQATLRPYQRRGVSWLAFMDSMGLGAVLADDMGLGKTIQVLALLLHERAGGTPVAPTLLVCPLSLLGNWSREAARFAPSLRVAIHHGAQRKRGERLDDYAHFDLVLTSYGLLTRDVPDLRRVHWHRIVLDEAHHVKNTGTRQAKAVRDLPAQRRIALTGTPVENRLEELRGVLDAVHPGILGSAEAFRDRFARPIEQHRDKVATSRLRAVTQPFLLRRVKTDSAIITDLPEKMEMVVQVPLTKEQAALYKATVDTLLRDLATMTAMQKRGAVLRTLMHLKQICNHPAHFLGDSSELMRRGQHRSGKLAVVDEIVQQLLAEGDSALLFTQFTEFGHLLVAHLQQRFGVQVPFLHGGSTRRQRDEMVQDFQQKTGASPLFVLSLKAGGTGLNLTAANHVVHVDRWWNPAVENQATDRAFRIGQRQRVQVRKLVTSGTVEEKIDSVINGKAELAQLAVGSGDGWITELGTDALRDLLTLSPGAFDA